MKSFEFVFLNHFILLIISVRIFGDNFEASNETSVVVVNEAPNNYMFSYKSPMQSANYLNYRVQYGLRYFPKKNLKIKNSEEKENSTFHDKKPVEIEEEIKSEEVQSASFESEIFSNPNDGVENNFEETSSTLADVELNVTDNNSHHIMKPNNRVEYALDFLAERLKRLIFFGNQPGSNQQLSPHLSSIGRFLGLFNKLRFESFPCVSGRRPLRQLSGTCYNELECIHLGGIVLDRCANGLGVCCICKKIIIYVKS
jgi:hypothetical protein